MTALLSEMVDVGFERASVKSIALRAGLASGLVHYHFASKEEILLALVASLIERADSALASATSELNSPEQQIQAFIRVRLSLGPEADAEAVRAWVAVISEALNRVEVRELVATWLERDLRWLSKRLRATGRTRAKAEASLLLSSMVGSFVIHALNVSGVPGGFAEPQLQSVLKSWLLGLPSKRTGSERSRLSASKARAR